MRIARFRGDPIVAWRFACANIASARPRPARGCNAGKSLAWVTFVLSISSRSFAVSWGAIETPPTKTPTIRAENAIKRGILRARPTKTQQESGVWFASVAKGRWFESTRAYQTPL